MSITLKKDQWKVKDPSTGTYRGSAIFSTTLPEDAAQIVEDATDALDAQQVRAQEIVNDAQNAVNGINGLRETMIASIASVAGQGTDTTLTTPGVAADAAACGDLKNILPSLLDPVNHSVYNSAFTVTKSGNKYISTWTTQSFAYGALIFDTKKIKLSLANYDIAVAYNTDYGRVVLFNIQTGKLAWQKSDNSSAYAEIKAYSVYGFDKTQLVIEKLTDTSLIISDGTKNLTIDFSEITNWNYTLYPSCIVGVVLNTNYINGYPVMALLDDYNGNRKDVANMIAESDPLYGKKIAVLGDSYIAGASINPEQTWWYLLAQKHNMTYDNQGISGNCIVFDNGSTPMVDRYTNLANDADIIIVQGGKNDFNWRANAGSSSLTDEQFKAAFKSGLETLCMRLIKKYRTTGATIIFGTPWSFPCDNDPDYTVPTGVYVPFKSANGYTIPIQWFSDTIIEICGKHGIPVFDCSRKSGVYLWTVATEILDSWQNTFFVKNDNGYPDYSHLNPEGMRYIMPRWEHQIEMYFSDYST